VACNGLVFIDQQEAIIIDTPTDQASSIELIKWIETVHNSEIKAVVVTHFHEDCLGGLIEFHRKQIPSFSNNLTIDLAKSTNKTIPQNGFAQTQNIVIGKKTIISDYLGEGHTKDNIICYIPNEKILFGGCLIKALGAGKGNLDDANTNEWSNTVEKVKSKYGNSKTVVPGHGQAGKVDLLEYTIDMFRD
jgi:metallo-beta-lactamase class B